MVGRVGPPAEAGFGRGARFPRLLGRDAASLLTVLTLSACAARGGASRGVERSIPVGLDVSVRETRYEVTGSTAAEIRSSILRKAPSDPGFVVYGITRWSTRWTIGFRRHPVGCAVDRVKVRLEIETELPRWSRPSGAPEALVHRWERFMTALRAHERGHEDVAFGAAEEIIRAVSGMTGVSCTALRHAANGEARRITREYRERNAAYDERTRGGRRQGVRWP